MYGETHEGYMNLSLRTKSRVFNALFYSATAFIFVFFCWLFLSGCHLTSWESISELLARGWFWRSLKLTVITSIITTLIALIIGLPAAYAMSRFDFRGKAALEVFLSSIIILPAATIGIILMVTFQYEPFLKLQDHFNFHVVHSILSIIIAQLVLALVFGIKSWKAAFDNVNFKYEYVARSLGSSRIRTFFTITLPAAKTGIIAGIILAFTRAAAEFGVVLIMASTFRFRDISHFSGFTRFLGVQQADILPVAMWMEMEEGHTEQGVAIAFVMVATTAIFIYLFNKIRNIGSVFDDKG